MSYAIELLSDSHNRSAFDCGVESLNRYLWQQASQDIRRNVATVYVATTGEEVAGYYSLANTGVSLKDNPNHLYITRQEIIKSAGLLPMG